MATAVNVLDIPDPSTMQDADMLREILATVRRTESALRDQQERVAKLEKEVDKLNKEVYSLKNLVNSREQELRSKTVRVIGFPFTDEEKASTDAKFLSKKVYDRLLSPIFNHARSTNQIDRTPQLATAIDSCFRLRASTAITGTASPPPIILRFSSDQFKTTIMRNKRLHLPRPTKEEVDTGIRRFNIVEDLTPPAYSLLRELQREESITKAWSAGGRLLFTVRGNDRVHSVKSVFDSVPDILANIKI